MQIVVTQSASMAWMIGEYFTNPMRTPPYYGFAEREIEALPAGATAPVVLASYSANIVPMSLAATPGHIYWLEASGPRTFAAP